MVSDSEVTEPKIGEVRKGGEIGYKSRNKYIWQSCPNCNIPRWVNYSKINSHRLCDKCSRTKRRLPLIINPNPPNIGEVRKGRDIGRIKNHTMNFIWQPCPQCHIPRWVGYIDSQHTTRLCQKCANLNRIRIPTIINTPPVIGEIRKGEAIGKFTRPICYSRFIYQTCNRCGKAKWVQLIRGVPISTHCQSCRMKPNSFTIEPSMGVPSLHLTDTERAFIAGIIEGEGSINLVRRQGIKFRNNTSLRPEMNIANCDYGLMRHIKNIIRVGVLSRHTFDPHYRRLPLYIIGISAKGEVLWLLDQIIPYLVSIRRQRADLLYRFLFQRLKRTDSTMQRNRSGKVGVHRINYLTKDDWGIYNQLIKIQPIHKGKNARRTTKNVS